MNLECKINYYVNNVDGESVKTSKTVLVMDPANYTEAETLAMKHTSVIEKEEDVSSDTGEFWVFPIREMKINTYLPKSEKGGGEADGAWYLCTCEYMEEVKGKMKSRTHKVLCFASDSSLASEKAIESAKEIIGVGKECTCKAIKKTETNCEQVYDVVFNDDTASNCKRINGTYEYCMQWIEANRNDNTTYFGDYKGGTVSVVEVNTGNYVYTENI
jgi:hypothetical protein